MAPNGRNSETPLASLPSARRRAKRGASCVWTCGMGVSDFRRFGAVERSVWPVWRAGTVAPLGVDVGHRTHLDKKAT
eukprot:1595886-Alexandrium_andersonii.AAC.1